MFPPLRSCSRVLTPFQLLENQTPPLEFWTVIPTVSSDPGLPLSSIDSCTVWLPAIEIGLLISRTSRTTCYFNVER